MKFMQANAKNLLHSTMRAHLVDVGKEMVEVTSTSVFWIESEKQAMTDCLAKKMEATQHVKEIFDKKIVDMEAKIGKYDTTLRGIIETVDV